MGRLPFIAELNDAAEGFGFYLCARKEVRTGRGGADFISLVLQDVSGKVLGRGNRHNQKLEVVIEKIRRVDPSHDRLDGFREEDCIPCSPRPLDEMWAELGARVAGVQNAWVRRLLEITMARYGDRLRIWPAALLVHHAYRGGLLEHILKIAEVGSTLAAAYGADADLVVAGAVLHDIGKLEELGYDGVTTYSRRGNLLGHITMGAQMVREMAAEIDGFPEDLRTRIEHLVVSHHGERELGSPVEPMTEEAFILSAIDDLDAQLHQFRRHVAEDGTDGDFTAYHPRFRRVLLKPSGR
jgi:3'-5' exoribonuclease